MQYLASSQFQNVTIYDYIPWFNKTSNLAFKINLFRAYKATHKKSGYFTVRLTVSKCENFDPHWNLILWHLKHILSHCEGSQNAFFMPFSWLQMIIRRDQPLTNDNPEEPASCKWSSRGTGLLQMIIHHPRHPRPLFQHQDSISRTFPEQLVLV